MAKEKQEITLVEKNPLEDSDFFNMINQDLVYGDNNNDDEVTDLIGEIKDDIESELMSPVRVHKRPNEEKNDNVKVTTPHRNKLFSHKQPSDNDCQSPLNSPII